MAGCRSPPQMKWLFWDPLTMWDIHVRLQLISLMQSLVPHHLHQVGGPQVGPRGSVLPRLPPCQEPQGMAMTEPDNEGAVPELRVLERQRAGLLGQMHRVGTGLGSGLSRSGCHPPAPKDPGVAGRWKKECTSLLFSNDI